MTSTEQDRFRFDVRSYIVYLGFLVVFVFFAVTLRDTGFLTLDNFMSIVRQSAPIAVMAVGMAFVLSAGEIDLSIGSVVALSALTAALILSSTGNLFLAVGSTLAVGVLIGLFNGLATVSLRVPSFLVTLGTMSIVAGLARGVTGLDAVPVTHAEFNFWFGSGSIGPLSILLLWAFVVATVGHFLYRNTKFGRRVLATGGDPLAATALGIHIKRVKVAVLIMSSTLAALAGMLYAGRLHGARYTLGDADLLTVIAATVVGGTSLFGGRGSIVGAVAGALLMGMLNNGLVIMGLSVSEQLVARGLVIIVAVALSLRGPRDQ
ncbi:MAG: ABC transporter permease [Actinomycetota bacterium]|nr:ABC transporter permease [Actinomycetota bacterium]